MLVGLIAGLAAGAFWGLTFVAPQRVAPYGGIDLTVLRYVVFGLLSLVLMALIRQCRPERLSARQMGQAVFLGLTGYVIYYALIAVSVRLSGPAIAPLVVGAIPLVLAIYGNLTERIVPWRLLIPPLAMMAAGLLIVNAAALSAPPTGLSSRDIIWGALAALAGMAVWCVYGVANAKAMRAPAAPGAFAWTGLQGVGAMIGVIPLAVASPLLGWSAIPAHGLLAGGGGLLIWAVITGALGSWVAQYAWSIASQRLPLAVSAQLIVSETLFALVYGFLHEGRWPFASEWIGGLLLTMGVLLGMAVFRKAGAGSSGHA
jgi:drug/metabolite transporter (DMT)-like permease